MRVAAIADADSFVKWSASLLASVPDVERTLVVVDTELTVSLAQQKAALERAGLDSRAVVRTRFDLLAERLTSLRPDVVIIGGRGPFVRLVGTAIDSLEHRPVTVSGLPGMSIPAQRGALTYRRHTDLLIVHSHRERRAFAELGDRIGVSIPMALATLPFAERPALTAELVTSEVAVGARSGRGGTSLLEPRVSVQRAATDLVFAAQSLVPLGKAERLEVVDLLIRAARANPQRRVVVKLRSRRGEAETHDNRHPYTKLFPAKVPSNLVFAYHSMSKALDTAAGLVTVSSTAAVEALARDIPVIALDQFGVSKSLLNTVFTGSNLFGDADDVIAGRFRTPSAAWMQENYFHEPEDATWWHEVQELLVQRETGALAPRTIPAPRGGALHSAWHRASVLGRADGSAPAVLARIIATPLVTVLSALKRRGSQSSASTWNNAATDYTLEPNPYNESRRR